MPSAIFYPAVSGDDGIWYENLGSGLSISTEYFYFGSQGAGTAMRNFIRFPNVTIPQGSVISSVYITFTSTSNRSDDVEVRIWFNDVDDASAPANSTAAEALVKTTASHDWTITANWVDGTQYNTPSLVTAFQEIVDRGGFASGNAVMALIWDNASSDGNWQDAASIDHVAGAQKAELHVRYTTPGELDEAVALDDTTWGQIYTGYLTEDVVVDDVTWGQNYTAYITEAVDVGDSMFAMPAMLTEDAEFNDTIEAWKSIAGPLTEDIELNDVTRGGFEYEVALTEAVEVGDTPEPGIEYILGFTDGVSVDDEADPGKQELITENLEMVDQATSGWIMNVAESLGLTETVTLKLQLIVHDFMELTETLTSQWAGSETISELLEMWEYAVAVEVFYDTVSEALGLTDVPTALHQMVEAVAESLGIAETSAAGVGFNQTVIETLSVIAAATVFKTIGLTNSETLGLTDTAQPGWQHTIAESLRLTDTSTLAWAAMLTLTESLQFTESVLNRFDIDETVAETLGLTVALSMQAALQEVVSETLEFGITVELDDELWECWVLNSNQFNASVYSGYGFNSYCVYNNVAYGAKSTAIYKLTGTTDDGDAFKTGMVLPDTRFGTIRNKRFRKAYFGLSGGTTPSIRMETESGSATFTITGSKANITRNLKGRLWTIKIQDFDSLDFVELFPVILSR